MEESIWDYGLRKRVEEPEESFGYRKSTNIRLYVVCESVKHGPMFRTANVSWYGLVEIKRILYRSKNFRLP